MKLSIFWHTSPGTEELCALIQLLCDLWATLPKYYRLALLVERERSYVALKLLAGETPEKLARDACLLTRESVESEMYERNLGIARDVSSRLGLAALPS